MTVECSRKFGSSHKLNNHRSLHSVLVTKLSYLCPVPPKIIRVQVHLASASFSWTGEDMGALHPTWIWYYLFIYEFRSARLITHTHLRLNFVLRSSLWRRKFYITTRKRNQQQMKFEGREVDTEQKLLARLSNLQVKLIIKFTKNSVWNL